MKSVYRVWALLALTCFSSASFHGRKISDYPDGRHQQQSLQPPLAPNRPSIDPNLVLILAALLCALFFGLGLNLMIRCALCLTSFLRITAVPGRGHGAGADQVSLAVGVGRPNTGLMKAVVDALPVVVYGTTGGAAMECVICLREFVEGEQVRVLPKCAHCFHVECIDRWFVSHSLCPICRAHMPEALDKKLAVNVPCTNCGRNATDESTGRGASQNVALQPVPPVSASCSGTSSNVVGISLAESSVS